MGSIKKLERIFENDIFVISLFYFLAYGVILLNEGIFFDDWTFYYADKANMVRIMREAGHHWAGYYYFFMFSLKNMFVFRVLVFCSYLFSAFFLNAVLKTVKEISDSDRLFVVLFFTLLPVNFARIAACISHYALGYFLFFLGFFILSRYLEIRKTLLRILVLLALFCSFFALNSLLVFYYGTIIIYIIYIECKIRQSKAIFPSQVLKYLDFLLLPAVFWAIKKLFFMPCSDYAAYNQITLRKMLTTRYNLNNAFNTTLHAPLSESFENLLSHPLLIISLAFLLLFLLPKREKNAPENKYSDSDKTDFIFLFFGIIALISGIYAYVAIGTIPSPMDWQSRYQMLAPLGASFFIIYFLKIFFTKKSQIFIFSLLTILFTYTNTFNYIDYQQDWFKQLSLIENFKTNEIIKNHTSFIFVDEAKDLNARNRGLRFYEWCGLFKKAFHGETRFGVLDIAYSNNMKDYESSINFNEYNMRDFKLKDPEYKVTLRKGNFKLSRTNMLKLFLKKITSPAQYKNDIRNIIILDTEKI